MQQPVFEVRRLVGIHRQQGQAGVQLAADVAVTLRFCVGFLEQRVGHLGRERHVELAGDEGEDRRRAVRDDGIFDAVEIRPPRLPVIRVARDFDVLVRFVVDKFEWAGADRMLAHVARRHVARVDRRIARGEQCEQRRLRPFEMKSGLMLAAGRGLGDIDPPGLAIVEAELLFALVGQEIEGAFDVFGGERLAVVPFDAVAQFEARLRAVLAPCPARGELGDDRLHAVLRNMLIEDH